MALMTNHSAVDPAMWKIRTKPQSGDLAAILELHSRLYSLEYGFDTMFEGYVAATLGHFARPSDGTRERLWLAEIDGRLIGCIGLIRHSEDEGQIRWFLVAPELRGRGLGRRLLAEAVYFARDRGYASVFLETVADLTASAHLYRELGFAKKSERSVVLWGILVVEQRYELQLQFSG